MLTQTPEQAAATTAIAKALQWLFDITPVGVGQPTLHWSLEPEVVGGTAYLGTVLPESFAGIRMIRSRTEAGLIPLPSCAFTISNAITIPYPSPYFDQASLIIRLRINGVDCRTWRMVVTSCVPGNMTLVFEAKGFLCKHMTGDLPKSAKVRRLDPTYQFNGDDCVPVAYGPAYLPLPCVLDNGYRHYLLGANDLGETYTISECASGADWPSKSSWAAADGFVFEQGAMSVGAYQLVRPLVYNLTGDSSDPEYVTGLSADGKFRPICARFSSSRTGSMTNPAQVISDALQQIGLDAADIDTGTAAATYTAWGLTWGGGWTRRQAAESFVAGLLAECHSEIDCRDKVYLRPCSAQPVFTISQVLDDGADRSSWGYTPQVTPEYDSGHVTYSAEGTPDDRRISAIIGADSSTANPGYDQFHLRLVHHSIPAQVLACLRYQRRLLVIGRPTWEGPLSQLVLQPGDVGTVDNNAYGAAGGSYRVVIDEMIIQRQGSIRFQGLRLSRMDDYADLAASFSELVVPEDGSEPTILPPYIDDLHDPNVLTRSEKYAIKKEFDGFTQEKASLDAKADALGVVTEKAAYDAAYTSLHAVLNPAIGVAGLAKVKSEINGTDYRTAWTNYISARALLLSAISVKASTMATWATVTGAGKPADNATVGAPNGTYVGGTLAQTVESNASTALANAATAQSTANTAASNATAALAILTDIASDSLLTPVEKPLAIAQRDVIVAEQSGIDAQATAYGITTEKTAYNTAVTALTTYLATLTSPVSWTTLSGNTTIVGATFRTKFNDVYAARQSLLNKIAEVAGTKAIWSGVSGIGKPADNADVTDYTDYRVANGTAENSVLTISRPVGASYDSPLGNATGAIVITLPLSWSNTMMRFAIDVFLYNGHPFTVYVGGYNFASSSVWVNVFAQLLGSITANNRVRFGHDGTKCCIVIGETTSVWPYPKVSVRDFQAGYSNFELLQWSTGWSVGVITDLTGYIFTADIADSLIDAASIKNQGVLATKDAADWGTMIGGAGKPADNATAGAPNGTYVGGTLAQTVENNASTALANAATAQNTANTAASMAAAALATLTDIASDSLLTPVEKPQAIAQRDVIVAEQGGIDAQATAYGITTEKSNYDTAVTALTTYLATLTTPVLWSTITGDTTIVGATFRTKFNDVYSARQSLLNKIAEVAGTKAIWSGVSGIGKPADNADVTDYTDYRVANGTAENSVLTISRPAGASYSASLSITGAIVITLPQSWTDTMLRFAIDVFLYSAGESFSLYVGGYTYTAGAAWDNAFAQLTGGITANNRVRFGHNGTKCCIVIGETTSVWPYPKVSIRAFQAGYLNFTLEQWAAGWTISVVADLAGYTFTADIADTLIDAASIKNQGVLATKNTANWTTEVTGAGKPADNATVDLWLTGINVTIQGNTVTNTGGSGSGFDAAAASVDSFTGGAFCSFSAAQTNANILAGLKIGYSGYIDYCWYIASNGTLIVYESGANMGGFGNYTTTTVLSVHYDGSNIRYLVDGVCVRTVAVATGLIFHFDSGYLNLGACLKNIKWSAVIPISWVNVAIGAGKPADNATGDLVLTGTNVVIQGNTVTKTAGVDTGWDAQVYSVESYVGGAYCSFQAGQTNAHVMVGLNTDPLLDASFASLDYAWYCVASGTLQIYESGSQVGDYGSYTTTTVLGLLYDGSNIHYLLDGVVQRTVPVAAGVRFYLDSSLASLNANITNIKFYAVNQISAALVRTGKLESVDANTYFDLDGKRLVINGRTDVGASSSGAFLGYSVALGEFAFAMGSGFLWTASGGFEVDVARDGAVTFTSTSSRGVNDAEMEVGYNATTGKRYAWCAAWTFTGIGAVTTGTFIRAQNNEAVMGVMDGSGFTGDPAIEFRMVHVDRATKKVTINADKVDADFTVHTDNVDDALAIDGATGKATAKRLSVCNSTAEYFDRGPGNRTFCLKNQTINAGQTMTITFLASSANFSVVALISATGFLVAGLLEYITQRCLIDRYDGVTNTAQATTAPVAVNGTWIWESGGYSIQVQAPTYIATNKFTVKIKNMTDGAGWTDHNFTAANIEIKILSPGVDVTFDSVTVA